MSHPQAPKDLDLTTIQPKATIPDNSPANTAAQADHSAQANQADQNNQADQAAPSPLVNAETSPALISQDQDAQNLLAFQNLERHRKEQKRKKRNRALIVAGVVMAIILALTLPKALSPTPTIPPYTATVENRALTSSITVSGTTQPISSVVVTPEVDGIIQDVQVSEGDTVKKGDLLFTLKNDTLDRAVSQAQAQVKAAQAGVSSAQAALDTTYATYQNAVKLWNSATSAAEQLQMQNPDALYAEVESAASSVETAKSSLDSAQQALKDAQDTAAKRRVVAPVAGSVVAVGAQNGAAFGSALGGTASMASTTLVQIADLSQMRVTTQVNEIDVTNLKVGDTANVTFAAIPNLTLAATVERIATVSSSTATSDPTASSYGTSGPVTYTVTLLIAQPDPRLKPGMSANAEIITQNIPDSLVIPIAALQEDSDGTFVEVITLDEKGAIATNTRTAVTVVAKNGTDAAVTGVVKGDTVLIPTTEDNGSAGSSDATNSNSDSQ